MADVSDVQNALVAVAAQAVYPNGTAQPSVAGAPVKVYAGWPTQSQLDADLAAGTAHVTVFQTGSERNTTRYSKDWREKSRNTATLTLTVAGQSVTVAGTIPAANNPQNLAVVANGQSFVYAAQTTDTLTGIATALATLIAAGIPGTTNNGAVITLPADARIEAARVGVAGTLIRILRNQERVFQVTIWASTPDIRNAVAQAVDVALADTQFLTLADGFAARLVYRGSPVTDNMQKSRLYRRDLMYAVDYATTQSADATEVSQGEIDVTAQDSNAAQVSVVQINL